MSNDGKTAGPEASAERDSASEPPSSPVAGGGEELLPCPFGCEAHPYPSAWIGNKRPRIHCSTCFAVGPSADSIKLASLAWNRRPRLSSPRVEEDAKFLLDRLSEFELCDDAERMARNWMGHVEPAIGRLRAALSPPQGE